MIFGGILLFLGGILLLLGRFGSGPLFRLPGDIDLHGKNWRVIFPLTTGILLSALLTLLLWLVRHFRK